MFTNLLSERVSVYDVEDVEGFVVSLIREQTRLRFQTQDERDEIVAEGIAILLRLSKTYEPHRPGYDRPGSFAGYCSKYLAKKITTAWHQMHPQHILKSHTDEETGKVVKRYEYGEAPVSWEEQIERDESVDSDTLRGVGNFVSSRS